MQVYINHLQGMLPKGLGLIIGGNILFFSLQLILRKEENLLNAMKGENNGQENVHQSDACSAIIFLIHWL